MRTPLLTHIGMHTVKSRAPRDKVLGHRLGNRHISTMKKIIGFPRVLEFAYICPSHKAWEESWSCKVSRTSSTSRFCRSDCAPTSPISFVWDS